MVNFLALLGWSPGDDRELMSLAELIESFTLEGISGGNAVFDTAKLDWMNGQYIARMPIEQLAGGGGAAAHRGWAVALAVRRRRRAVAARLLELLRPRAKRLTDFVDQARPFLVDTVEYDPEAIEKHLSTPDLAGHLGALREALGDTYSLR